MMMVTRLLENFDELGVRYWSEFFEAVGKNFEIMSSLLQLCWSIHHDVQLKYDYVNRIAILWVWWHLMDMLNCEILIGEWSFKDEYDSLVWLIMI